jgi:transcriptional regulator with XRE-family HTH domain
MHITAMKLTDYMSLKGLSDEEMGNLIGKERSVVSKYRSGAITPTLQTIARLEEITDRAVSFRDFLAQEESAAS